MTAQVKTQQAGGHAMREVAAILALASRDLLKFLRDRPRLVASLVFPAVFIVILGGSFETSLGDALGYNYLTYTFTGVLAQTLFQTAAQGLISLIEDRDNDFSQEIFVSPISRYSIIVGKILGESLVAMAQAILVIFLGLIIGVPMTLWQAVALIPVAIVAAFFGGSFGVLVLSNLTSRRAAEQIFPFLILPQFFLAGVFSPLKGLPWYLDLASHIAPMRYAVDLLRGIFYAGTDEYAAAVVYSPFVNFVVIAAAFTVFLIIGTWTFVRKEQNR